MAVDLSAAKLEEGRSKDGGTKGGSARLARGVTAYFVFILVSTMCRSYESGIISSEMPAIKEELHVTYTMEGFLAAASDYGLLPSGLLAMLILTRLPAYNVLWTVYCLIGVISLLCVFFPSYRSLVVTRSATSLLWGTAAVHYPAWVNCHGSEQGKTMQFAVLNAVMLVGILGGYLVGGIARSMGGVRWTVLYGAEAILMFACTFAASFFDKSLAQATKATPAADAAAAAGEPQAHEEASESTPLRPSAERSSSLSSVLPADLVRLLRCPLYVASVGISSAIAGVVGFILYFVTQVMESAIGFDKKTVNVVVAVVFIFGPVTGNISGGWVLSKFGGYQNYVCSFRLVLLWVFLSLVCSSFLSVAVVYHSRLIFALSIFGLLFFGASPIAAINGAAVNAVPGPAAATYGSGIQFFCQHLVKMLAPMIGGRVIDVVGLGTGFSAVVIAFAGLVNIWAAFAYWAALNHHSHLPSSSANSP